MKDKSEYFIGCDWGTSSFRLRLINPDNNSILAEIESKEGIAFINDQLTENKSRFNFFCTFLGQKLDILQERVEFNISNLTLVLSGMASSSIGMEELEYGILPYELGHPKGLITKFFDSNSAFQNPVILVSGLRDQHDVMRGEEVQLSGLAEVINFGENDDCVVILPGTHSKHCFIENGALTHFQTFLTGELFQLLSEHSILSNSIHLEKVSKLNPEAAAAFEKGVLDAKETNLLTNLFRVRTNVLFDILDKKANALYLSGLLLGEELGNLANPADGRPIVLCGAEGLNVLYQKAIEVLKIEHRMQLVPDDILVNATLVGQSKIYKEYAVVSEEN